MTIDELLAQHRHIALQFSGGRDSLALLLLLKPHWDKLTVYFTNSGDAYPETLALIKAVSAVVPNFVEIQGRVKSVHAELGWPSDVLQPGTGFVFATETIQDYRPLIDRHICCMKSIMEPMHERMVEDGITLLLRGQRDEDTTKSHVQSGQVINGIQIVYPISHWTTADVERFIRDADVPMPPFYEAGMTSAPDCMHCTAWLEHGADKYLKANHPFVSKEVGERFKQIRLIVEPSIKRLSDAEEHMNGIKL